VYTFIVSFLSFCSDLHILPPGPSLLNFYFMTFRTFRLCILAAAWIILGSATPIRHNAPAAKQTYYYWFWADTDYLYEYATTGQACTDLMGLTGKTVNTQQAGGTLIVNGYILSNQPHTGWPQVLLYTH
jgi:hypothetical protein